MSKHLFVVAHPDDEVLGAGAFIYDAVKRGDEVAVVIMNTFDFTRYIRKPEQLGRDMLLSQKKLGIYKCYRHCHPDSNFHNTNHREMVEQIEFAIRDFEPDNIFTQYPGDINTDHYWTAASCMEAFRLWQRGRGEVHPVSGLYLMEVQSSTDWGLNPCEKRFEPNWFVEVSEDGVNAMIDSLKTYENVIRPVPHPRSEEALWASVRLRGAQSGYPFAQAFDCVFRRGAM